MTLAYWCLFILMFFPWICTIYAKKTGGFTVESNRNAREFFEKATGAAARANAAQLNSFEIFPVFAAAVIIAHLTGNAAQSTINLWAVIFVLSRIAYCYCYVADLARLRSMIWGVGLICIIGLFIAAA